MVQLSLGLGLEAPQDRLEAILVLILRSAILVLVLNHAHLGVVLWSLRREAPSSLSQCVLKSNVFFGIKTVKNEKNAQRDANTAHCLCRRGPSSISVPNLKRIALFIQKLLGGPKFRPTADPLPGGTDRQNLISWRWSLPLPTNPVW